MSGARLVAWIVLFASAALAATAVRRAVDSLSTAADAPFALASSAVGRAVDVHGETLVVPRRASRLEVPPAGRFVIESDSPLRAVRCSLAFDADVAVVTIGWPVPDRADDRVVVRFAPLDGFECGVERITGGVSTSLAPRLRPSLAPTPESASLEFTLESGRLVVGIDGAEVARSAVPLLDLRGGSIECEGGGFAVRRASWRGEGAVVASEDFDRLPAVRDGAEAARATWHCILAFAAILACWLLARGRNGLFALSAGGFVLGAVFVAVGAYVAGAIGPPLPATPDEGPDEFTAVAREESIHLHAGNRASVAGTFRDFELRIRLATTWNSALEVRLRDVVGSDRNADRVSFLLTTEPLLENGFARGSASTGRRESLGFATGATEPNQLLDLVITARGSLLRAFLVDQFAATAKQEEQAVIPVAETYLDGAVARRGGDVVLLAQKGSLRVDRIEVAPLTAERATVAATPSVIARPARLEIGIRARYGAVALLAFALLCVVFASNPTWRAMSIASPAAATAVAPLLVRVIDPPRAFGVVGDAIATVPLAVLGIALAAIVARRPAHVTVRFGALLSWTALLVLTVLRIGGAPAASPLLVLTEHDIGGRAHDPDVALLKHGAHRRGLGWLDDHRFHGQELEPRRDGDPLRVMLLGDSEVLGNDATAQRRSRVALAIERGLDTGAFERGATVFDATWRDASVAATLDMLENVILARRPDPSVATPHVDFAPDVAVLLLPLSALAVAREAVLADASRPGAFRRALDVAAVEWDILRGADRTQRADAAALAQRLVTLGARARAAGTRLLCIVPPVEGFVFPFPFVLDAPGGFDLYAPVVPAVTAGAPTYRDGGVLAPRGRQAFADQVARFLRKRSLQGPAR